MKIEMMVRLLEAVARKASRAYGEELDRAVAQADKIMDDLRKYHLSPAQEERVEAAGAVIGGALLG